jgi:hypothetical protein
VLEAAASELAQDLAQESLQVEDWYVMFCNRGKNGPFETQGEAFKGTDGKYGVRINLIDRGNDDRVVSTCAATFRKP